MLDHTNTTSQIECFSLICPPVLAKIKIRERCGQIEPAIRASSTRVVKIERTRLVGIN